MKIPIGLTPESGRSLEAEFWVVKETSLLQPVLREKVE
jgi:hypothetical protein